MQDLVGDLTFQDAYVREVFTATYDDSESDSTNLERYSFKCCYVRIAAAPKLSNGA